MVDTGEPRGIAIPRSRTSWSRPGSSRRTRVQARPSAPAEGFEVREVNVNPTRSGSQVHPALYPLSHDANRNLVPQVSTEKVDISGPISLSVSSLGLGK
jgi:hypothetical protein